MNEFSEYTNEELNILYDNLRDDLSEIIQDEEMFDEYVRIDQLLCDIEREFEIRGI